MKRRLPVFRHSGVLEIGLAILCTAGCALAAPADKKSALELAAIAFRQNEFSQAKAYLKRALRSDPRDAYANDFLATIYFLEENLEAALKYWNRISKPEIEKVEIDPPAGVRPILLERCIAGSSKSRLEWNDFLEMQAVLQSLDAFSHYRIELSPRPDEKFDLVFHTLERTSWKSKKLPFLLSFLRGIPYQTVYPELYNLQGSAAHWLSLVRWDAHKLRFLTSYSAPLGDNPKRRYRFYLDARNENWNLSEGLQERAGGEFEMMKTEAGVEIQSIVSGRWAWKSGLHLAYRTFAEGTESGGNLHAMVARFEEGLSLKSRAGFDAHLLRIPERRFNVRSSASLELGNAWTRQAGLFSKMDTSVRALWLPQATGNDYQVIAQFRSGRANGPVPLDELFVLGVERDSDLWLRGHKGTRRGRKGNAPLGRAYLLFNGELDKRIFRHSFIELAAGPFLDTGKVYDASHFGSTNWLWNAGVQGKLKVLSGPTISFSWGKDLRSGGNAFFATLSR